MTTCHATTRERLESVARTLVALDIRRAEINDDTLGRGVESFLVNRELRELEHLARRGRDRNAK